MFVFPHVFFSINKNQTNKTHRGKENGPLIGSMNYEELLAEGDPMALWDPPKDEWDSLSLCYTSGTTADPKGAPNGYKKKPSEWKDVRVEMFVCSFLEVLGELPRVGSHIICCTCNPPMDLY